MVIKHPQADEGMSLDDFLQEHHDFELIDGRRIEKMPPGFKHSLVLRAVRRILEGFVEGTDLGEVFSETAFIVLEKSDWVRGLRLPDVSFYQQARIQPYMTDVPAVLPLVPDLVIEILSSTDLFLDIQDKTNLDLDNGVKVVWIIDPQSRGALVYTADTIRPKRFGENGILRTEIVLPNFALELCKIWV